MDWLPGDLLQAPVDHEALPVDDICDDYTNFIIQQQQILCPESFNTFGPYQNQNNSGTKQAWTQFLPYSFRQSTPKLHVNSYTNVVPQFSSSPISNFVPSLTYTSDARDSRLESSVDLPQDGSTFNSHRNSQVISSFSLSLDEEDEVDDLVSLDDRASLISRYSTGRSSLRSQGRKIARFSRTQTEILQVWLRKNQACPYPSQGELRTLSQVTGLKVQQVRNWFSRTRTRKLAPSVRSVSTASSVSMSIASHQLAGEQETARHDLDFGTFNIEKWSQQAYDGGSFRASSPMSIPLIYELFDDFILSDDTETNTYDLLSFSLDSMVDWWLGTLPLETSDFVNSDLNTEADAIESRHKSETRQTSHAPSLLYGERVSSATSSSCPVNVLASSTMTALTTGRRGRRRFGTSTAMQALSSDLDQAMKIDTTDIQTRFTCSYCDASFGRKASCKRHEESVHAPKDVFICQPLNSHSNGGCPFCPRQNITCQHDFVACTLQRSEADRTFFRRDGFTQHLRNVHKVDAGLLYRTANLDLWRKPCAQQPETVSATSLLKSIIAK